SRGGAEVAERSRRLPSPPPARVGDDAAEGLEAGRGLRTDRGQGLARAPADALILVVEQGHESGGGGLRSGTDLPERPRRARAHPGDVVAEPRGESGKRGGGGRPEAAEPPGGRSAHLRHPVRESGGKGRYRRGRVGGSIAEGASGGRPLWRVRRAAFGEQRRPGLAA